MEKNKKVLEKFVFVFGGSRGEIEEVEYVEYEGGMEEYLRKLGEDSNRGYFESCRNEEDRDGVREMIEEFGMGNVIEYDSSVVGKVYGMCLSEEEELYVFEGNIEDFEDFDCLGDLIDYLEI